MPKSGGRRKKTRTHVALNDEDYDKVPKSKIISIGY